MTLPNANTNTLFQRKWLRTAIHMYETYFHMYDIITITYIMILRCLFGVRRWVGRWGEGEGA